MTLKELQSYVKKFNIALDDTKLAKFAKYSSILLDWNEKINLTSITDEGEVVEKHFLDSILPMTHMDFSNKVVLDVGSGAGFPGVPLAIINESGHFVLLEPRKKRADFLILLKQELDLKNVEVICARAEEINKKEHFDIVISRAVAPLNILLELVSKLIKLEGYFIAMKSQSSESEVKQAKNAFDKLALKYVGSVENSLPTNNDKRVDVVVRKVKATPNRYPRPFGEIKNNPL